MNKAKALKWLKLILRILLSALAVYIISNKVDIRKVASHFSSANVWLLVLAFAIFFISKIISAIRLNLFFRSRGLVITQKNNAKLYLLGMFYNLFVPGLGGDAYKVFWLNKRYKVKVKVLIWASLLDRVSGLVALTALALIFFYFSSYKFDYSLLALVLLPVMYLVYYFAVRIFFKSFLGVFNSANIYSLFVQLTQVACVYLLLHALKLEIKQVDYILIFLISCYAYMIPVVGVRELAFVWGAQQFGLDMEVSLSVSLLFYFALAITSLSGAAFLLWPKKLNPEEGRYDNPESTASA